MIVIDSADVAVGDPNPSVVCGTCPYSHCLEGHVAIFECRRNPPTKAGALWVYPQVFGGWWCGHHPYFSLTQKGPMK
jgi:hypothetical protein